MNLPDKIKMEYGIVVDFVAIVNAINQLIEYLEELEKLQYQKTVETSNGYWPKDNQEHMYDKFIMSNEALTKSKVPKQNRFGIDNGEVVQFTDNLGNKIKEIEKKRIEDWDE